MVQKIKNAYMYILSNKGLTTLYIGVTNNLERRIYEHKKGIGSVFTKKYNVNKLLYYEYFEMIEHAIIREKQLKNWHRRWKWDLIKSTNPNLIELKIDSENH